MPAATVETLQEKILDGHVVNRQEALELYNGSSLNELGAIADALKSSTKGDQTATYLIDRNINYTNVCVTYCKFCAFYREPGDTKEGYINEAEKIIHKVAEAKHLGATQILLQGGPSPGSEAGLVPEYAFQGENRSFGYHPPFFFAARVDSFFRLVWDAGYRDPEKIQGSGHGFHAGRRGRDIGGPGPQGDRSPEGFHSGMAGCHEGPAFAGDEIHRHHDVRPRGNGRGTGLSIFFSSESFRKKRAGSSGSFLGSTSRGTKVWDSKAPAGRNT